MNAYILGNRFNMDFTKYYMKMFAKQDILCYNKAVIIYCGKI